MMAELPEVFPDVKLLFDLEEFAEPGKVWKELQKLNPLEASPSRVSRTFIETEKNFVKLLSMEKKKTQNQAHKDRTSAQLKTSTVTNTASSSPVEPVEVDEAIMHYIQEKCSKELEEIKRPNVKLKNGKKLVTFCPLNPDQGTLQAHLARERFVTFYQKIATGLQTKTYDLDRKNQTLLAKFPEFLVQQDQGKYRVTLTGSYLSLEKFEQLLKNTSIKKSATTIDKTENISSTASSSASLNKPSVEEKTCSICLEPMVKSQTKTLEKCKHSFCRECLRMAFEIKPICPTCGEIYGQLTGTQPKGGRMKVIYDKHHLPGYEKWGTIIIHYVIPDGIQGDEHPNPGQPYHGVTRQAYLPQSSEGKNVLNLLTQAFKQRLIFTIGRSSTTGMNNVVTWNDIHHKTSCYGGPTAYGYPDPDYLKRVQEELKVKGIC